MKCSDVRDLVAHALDEPLPAADAATVDAHFRECPACVRWMTEQVLTVEVLRGLGRLEDAEVSPPVPANLVARALAARTAEAGEQKKKKKRRGSG